MQINQLKKKWITEEQRAFQGWDFSHLDSRWQNGEMPWDYKSIVLDHLHPADQLLDMGTGGGEFLRSLNHAFEKTAATETWQPNIQLCMETLAPLGIAVYPVGDDGLMPIAAERFDLVINRHASYNLHEVCRVLKPGGMFITQQVGSRNCILLETRINKEPLHHQVFSLESELPKFRDCGFSVQFADECFPTLRFFDVGAVVYWAKVIQWSFPGFSVEKNFEQLCVLQEELDRKGVVSDLEHRFIIVAQRKRESTESSHGRASTRSNRAVTPPLRNPATWD